MAIGCQKVIPPAADASAQVKNYELLHTMSMLENLIFKHIHLDISNAD